jgi:ADP-ribose pyrophosphatase YjhB (NUDIX family)
VTSYYASDPTAIRLSVSAVVWRDAPGGELLLMQRSDNGLWGLPGGYVEIGEGVAAACARQVLEETGVRIAVGRLIGVYSDPARQVIDYGGGRRVQAVNLCFEARDGDEPGQQRDRRFDDQQVRLLGGLVDARFDLVRDVRDHLRRSAQVVAAPLLGDHAVVDAGRATASSRVSSPSAT